jgi:hypothetical protein
VTIGEQRGDEPALVGEPEPAAEAPSRDLEGGQEPALAPELDRGLDRLLGREPVDRERQRAVRRVARWEMSKGAPLSRLGNAASIAAVLRYSRPWCSTRLRVNAPMAT